MVSRPTRRASRFSLRAPSSAQCIVKLDEIRIAVLTPAMTLGSSSPAAGHSAFPTTLMKK